MEAQEIKRHHPEIESVGATLRGTKTHQLTTISQMPRVSKLFIAFISVKLVFHTLYILLLRPLDLPH